MTTTNLTPAIFSGAKGQDAVMAAFADFLKEVPTGNRIHVVPGTTKKLNEIGQALGNMIAIKVADYNKGVPEVELSST